MANIRLIKNRIKSAKNIAQITKAMELVAASKMKKSQATAQAGKLYAEKIYSMVMKLAQAVSSVSHPLLVKPARPTGRVLVAFLSTNKGLCGALNANLFRFLLKEIPESNAFDYVSLGSKGSDLLSRLGRNVIADFSDTNSFIKVAPAITELVRTKFLDGSYDAVDLVFSEFKSAISQSPKRKTILPLTLDRLPVGNSGKVEAGQVLDFLIEPDARSVYESLLPHYLENQIYDAILQAEASEHSARMVAMRNATDNALSLTDELTLVYNKARQEKITYEITDLVTARLATE
jgi:F-type H+-transporting ATPase subunit gamma